MADDAKTGGLAFLYAIGGGILFIVAIVALSIVAHYVGWFGLATTASVRVQNANLGTQNILEQQHYFYDVSQQYQAALGKVTLYQSQLADDVKAHASPAQIEADRSGVTANQQTCITVAADYNAHAQNFNTGQFRSISLPSSLDQGACSK